MRFMGARNPMEQEDFIQMIPVIEEVEERLRQLVSRGDGVIDIDYGPEGQILSIMAAVPPSTLMKWHNDQLYVAWNGRKALNKQEGMVWLCDPYYLTPALKEIQNHMVLDDLADV